jgi:hypothetical protein
MVYFKPSPFKVLEGTVVSIRQRVLSPGRPRPPF